MKQTHRIMFPILVLYTLFSPQNIFSQSAIVTAGGSVTKDREGSVSMSIGQMDYYTIRSTEGSASFGVQQTTQPSRADVDITHTVLERQEMQLTIFPNPVTEGCKIAINTTKSYDYQLSDLSGRIVTQGKINHEAWIPMSNLPLGIYMLHISQNEKEISSHKIIKE